MAEPQLASFAHPQGVYSLRYPAHWDHIIQDGGRSCGFGPRDRDDVGLWISVLPMSLDSEQAELRTGLREMFDLVAGREPLANIREDPSLGHFGLKADSSRPGEAGRFWLVLGGDVVLFASTQVPEGARQEFEGAFDEVMASLRIHREEALRRIQFANEILERLQERFPDQGYRHGEGSPPSIRGKDHVVNLGNIYRRVEESPGRRTELIEEFIAGLCFAGDDAPSAEELVAVRRLILPIPRHADYARPDGPAAGIVHRAWLGGAILCYAIEGDKTLRFVLEKDRARWGIGLDELHGIALENLKRKPFPETPPAAEPGERVVLLGSGDGWDASRILHPRLHEVFAPVLGSPFLAGIPDRGTLVLFPRTEPTAARLAAQVREDFRRAAYPISPEVFLVGPDGVRVADVTGPSAASTDR